MLLGAHVPIGGGLGDAPNLGKSIGCDVIQIFSKNQQQWAAKPLDPAVAEAYKSSVKANGMGPSLVHCSYLLNLASPDDALWEKSVQGLIVELERAEALGIPFVVFHPGSPRDKGEAWGCARVAEGISLALVGTKGMRVMVLVENNAGAGTLIGDTLDEVAAVVKGVRAEKHRVGVCIDTCHAFVSGYPIHTAEGYEAFVSEFDEKIGLDKLKAFHLNDAMMPFGSKKDRHEHIGKGLIGDVAFWKLVTDPRFKDVPGYLEVPYEEIEELKPNLQYLRDLASGKRKPKEAPKRGQMTLGGDVAPQKASEAARDSPRKAAKLEKAATDAGKKVAKKKGRQG